MENRPIRGVREASDEVITAETTDAPKLVRPVVTVPDPRNLKVADAEPTPEPAPPEGES